MSGKGFLLEGAAATILTVCLERCFGRPDMGLGLKKVGEMNEMDENEQRTNADVRICFVDNNTTFFWAKAERVPILLKKLTECLRFPYEYILFRMHYIASHKHLYHV